MDKLQAAYAILDTIKDDDDLSIVYMKASKAYRTSHECLEALLLMASLEADEIKKDELLNEAIAASLKTASSFQHLRALFQKAKNAEEKGQNREALKTYQSLKELDIDDHYHTLWHIATLKALLEEEDIKELFDAHSQEEAVILPYALFLYKTADYADLDNLLMDLRTINPAYVALFKGLSDQEDQADFKKATAVMRNNALLINSCPPFISYVRKRWDLL